MTVQCEDENLKDLYAYVFKAFLHTLINHAVQQRMYKHIVVWYIALCRCLCALSLRPAHLRKGKADPSLGAHTFSESEKDTAAWLCI